MVRYVFQVEALPAGWTAEFLGSPTPFNNTLVLTTAGAATPGRYRVRMIATSEAGHSNSAWIELEVTPCIEFQSGEFTHAIQSNLVELITAGKPSIEHGLLVPLQVCGVRAGRRLQVTLLEVVSEAGSPMADPLRFYLYRSWAWPEPPHIIAHGTSGSLNVRLPRIENVDWRLGAEVQAGLYLLVFERDRYGSPTDPAGIPASVTYRLSILP